MSKAFSVRHTFHNAAEDAGNGAVLDVQGRARLAGTVLGAVTVIGVGTVAAS